MVVGRGALCVSDVSRAIAFYGDLGSRPILQQRGMAIVELRGGTHLVLFQAKGDHRIGPVRAFDLMVGDILSYRSGLAEKGIEVGPVWEDPLSRRGFEMTDPDGHVLTVISSDRGAGGVDTTRPDRFDTGAGREVEEERQSRRRS